MSKKMTFSEILMGIHMLSQSQGKFGRLLDDIYSLDEEEFQALKEHWDGAFTDMVEFILYIEM